MVTATFRTFLVPDDQDLLKAIAIVSIRHAHLDHVLRMTTKTLRRVTVGEALRATAFLGSAELRKQVRKLARRELGEGIAIDSLQSILERCRQATETRNDLIHGLFSRELDGEPDVLTRDLQYRPLPTVAELDELSSNLDALTRELNHARLRGFLAEALASANQAKPDKN